MKDGSHPRTNALKPFDLRQPLDVADAAVKDDAITGLREDRVAEIVADQGAVDDLAHAVGDVDIALLQHVDGPGIGAADPALGLAALVDHLLHIGPGRHVLGRQRPPDDGHILMEDLPAALELIAEALVPQDAPGILDGNVLHPLENVIGDLGPAVRRPLPGPRGSVELHAVHRRDAHFGLVRRPTGGQSR